MDKEVIMNVIFCIPYAGGSASAYSEMKNIASQYNVELVPLEYAGHASRIKENLCGSMEETADDIYRKITEYLNRNYVESYGIFGHSMGSWVLYEIVNRLHMNTIVPNPKKIFFSANTVPQFPIENRVAGLSDGQFWEYVYSQGGIDEQLYNNREFRDFILPVLKNDYVILENYASPQVPEKYFMEDMHVIGSRGDVITEEQLMQWADFAMGGFEIKWFDGDHFYFRECAGEVVRYLCDAMYE